MAGCEHTSKRQLSKKTLKVEEEPGAYCATITKTTYEITYECKECAEKWTEIKEESKFE